MGVDGRYVLALVLPPRPDREPFGANEPRRIGVDIRSLGFAEQFEVCLLKAQVNALRAQLSAIFDIRVQRRQQ